VPTAGSQRGLVFEIQKPPDAPDDAIVALFRDGEQVQAFAVTDLPDDQPIQIGDAGLEPGTVYRYLCGSWLGDELLQQHSFEVTAGPPPDAPQPPHLSVDQGRVHISWEPRALHSIAIYKRNVLAGDEAVSIGPLLYEGVWVDDQVTSGGIYAYSLRSIIYYDQVPWESEIGTEEYIEVP